MTPPVFMQTNQTTTSLNKSLFSISSTFTVPIGKLSTEPKSMNFSSQ